MRDTTLGGILLVGVAAASFYLGSHYAAEGHDHPPDLQEESYVVDALLDRSARQEPPGEVCDISAPPGVAGKIKLTQFQDNTATATSRDPNLRTTPTEVKCLESGTVWSLSPRGTTGHAWVAKRR